MKEKCCSRWHEVKWKIAQKFLIFMTVTKRDIRHNWKMLCKTVSIIQQCHTCRDQTCFLKLGFTPSNNYVNWCLVLTVNRVLTMFYNNSYILCNILSHLNIFHICSSCCKMGRKHAKWHHNKNRPPKDLT